MCLENNITLCTSTNYELLPTLANQYTHLLTLNRTTLNYRILSVGWWRGSRSKLDGSSSPVTAATSWLGPRSLGSRHNHSGTIDLLSCWTVQASHCVPGLDHVKNEALIRRRWNPWNEIYSENSERNSVNPFIGCKACTYLAILAQLMHVYGCDTLNYALAAINACVWLWYTKLCSGRMMQDKH